MNVNLEGLYFGMVLADWQTMVVLAPTFWLMPRELFVNDIDGIPVSYSRHSFVET